MIERYGLDAAREKLPVPAKPLHLCPSCDYNLTGLISRRCPECGDSFTLDDARHRGIETSNDMRSFVRNTKWDRTRRAIGIGLMCISFVVVNWVRVGPLGGLNIYTDRFFSFAGFMLLWFIASSLAIGAIVRFYLDLRWASVVLAVGILCAAAAVICLF